MNRISELNGLQYHPFRNDANTAVPAYGIIKITGINTTEGMTSLTGAQPDANTGGYAVNGPCEVAAGKYGQCTLTGPCVFQYDTGTPAVNEFYSAKSGQWTANKTGSFIRCLGIIDSTNKFALGVIGGGGGGTRWVFGKLDGNLNYGSTATVSIYSDTSTDTNENITSVSCPWLTSGKKLNTAAWVGCNQNVEGNWFVTTGPCEVAQ